MVIFQFAMLNYQRVHHPRDFLFIRKSQTLVGMVDDWVDEIGFSKLFGCYPLVI